MKKKRRKRPNYHYEGVGMVRKNMYITKGQDETLHYVKDKIGKLESTQMREALDLYFMELGLLDDR